MPHAFTREVPPVTAAWHQNKAHFRQVSNFPVSGICYFSTLPALVLVTRQEFQLLPPIMLLSKTETRGCSDQKPFHLCHFHLWSFSSHQFRVCHISECYTLLCAEQITPCSLPSVWYSQPLQRHPLPLYFSHLWPSGSYLGKGGKCTFLTAFLELHLPIASKPEKFGGFFDRKIFFFNYQIL